MVYDRAPMAPTRERVFSGVQPTGVPHLGNLLGAFRHWVTDQETHECLYCVVDLHSITVPYDPAELREASLAMATLLMAVGVDPERSILFVQSHVREHTELAWILNCIATFGEVRRMTQFKESPAARSRSASACSITRCCRPRTCCSTTLTACRSATTSASTWS